MSLRYQEMQRFELGEVVVTKEASRVLEACQQAAQEFLERHQNGDWGNLSAVESDENDRALIEDSYLRSVYQTANGTRLWVLTSADRSTTTVLVAP